MNDTVRSPDSPTTELIPELAHYRDEFERAKTSIEPLIEGLDDNAFNWRPRENQWSVAECLDHLCVIGTLILPKIDEGIATAEAKGWTSQGPFKYGVIGNWFISLSGPSESARKRKFRAPKMYTPTSNHSISRLRTTFVGLQDDLIERLHRANGYDLAKVKIPSPITRLLRLSLGQWFTLLAGHQQRHFLQAQDVRDLLDNQK